MPEKKTIRDINIDHRRSTRRTTKKTKTTSSAEEPMITKKKKPPLKIRERRREGGTMWLIVLLVLVLLGIFLATILGRTKVTVSPEQADADINIELVAKRNAGNNELRFDIMSINDSVSESVPATESGQVERKASGTIVIFNEESTAQKLREETRFESPEGLIYKLPKGEGVTVPAGSADKPGSVEVVVYADEAGDRYNIDLVDFVIPGWREIKSAKFKTQYARSKTAMAGGFIGIERTVDPNEQTRVEGALREALKQRLLMSAQAQKTDQFVFFENGTLIQYKDIQQGEGTDDNVDLVADATLSAVLFNKEELSSIIAAKSIENYAGDPIIITNFDELQFALANKDTFEPMTTEQIAFTISGTPHFEWLINTDELSKRLQGIHKKEFNSVLPEFAGIKRAELAISPFWKNKIVEDTDKINIVIIDSVR